MMSMQMQELIISLLDDKVMGEYSVNNTAVLFSSVIALLYERLSFYLIAQMYSTSANAEFCKYFCSNALLKRFCYLIASAVKFIRWWNRN